MKNIEINIKTQSGYEVLYPNIQASNVVDFNEENLILNQSTSNLYGISNGTPDQIFQKLSNTAIFENGVISNILGNVQYTGQVDYGSITAISYPGFSITFPFQPLLVCVKGTYKEAGNYTIMLLIMKNISFDLHFTNSESFSGIINNNKSVYITGSIATTLQYTYSAIG